MDGSQAKERAEPEVRALDEVGTVKIVGQGSEAHFAVIKYFVLLGSTTGKILSSEGHIY